MFVAVVTVVLLGIIGLVVDGGGKLRATERADAIAIEAARAGGQAIDPTQAIPGNAIRVDPAAAQAAAAAYLQQAGATGTTAISSDGTQLTVTITATYATKFLPAVGISSMAVTGHGHATLLHGVTQPEGS